MQRFKVTVRIKDLGPANESIETSGIVIAPNAMSALKPYREFMTAAAPKDIEDTDAD